MESPPELQITNPIEYLVDSPQKHIAVLYEDERRAKMVLFWYLIHGLTKGQHCVYTTHKDEEEERAFLKASGIDVDYYEKERGLLHIKKINILENSGQIPSSLNQLAMDVFNEGRPPFRAVVRLFDGDFDSEEKKSLCTEVEARAQEGFNKKATEGSPFTMFAGYDGSLMCHHPVEGAGLELISNIIRAHDATILASKSGRLQFVTAMPSDQTLASCGTNKSVIER